MKFVLSAAFNHPQHLVPLAGGVDVLEAVLQLQRLRVEDRELLLQPDREVGGGVERLACLLEIQAHVAAHIIFSCLRCCSELRAAESVRTPTPRLGRSTAHTEGRRPGSTCEPLRREVPAVARRSS